VIICVSHARPFSRSAGTLVWSGPRAGRVFTGGYVWVSNRLDPASWRVSCDATLGGRLAWDGGASASGDLYIAGGVHLKPVVRRSAATLTLGGTRYTTLVTCAWRIPASATGKLLSLVRPRRLVPCDVSCAAWGVHFEDSGELKECNQTTWRVRARNASIGRETSPTSCSL
jgi:hypothetical protein